MDDPKKGEVPLHTTKARKIASSIHGKHRVFVAGKVGGGKLELWQPQGYVFGDVTNLNQFNVEIMGE